MLLTLIFFHHICFLVICILDLLIYYKFESIIFFYFLFFYIVIYLFLSLIFLFLVAYKFRYVG